MKSKKYALLALLLWATAMIPKDVMGQCTNCNANYPYLNGGYSTTSSAWTTLSSSVEGGDYSCYNVSTSYMYQWTTCPSSTGGYGTQLTLYTSSTGSCSGTSVYNDDYCGTRSLVSYKPSSNGGVRCLVSKYNCATDASLTYFTTLQWRAIPQTPTITGGGVTICSGSSTTLTASNIGSNNDDYVDVQWSTSSSGGTDVSSDATSITVSPTSTTTYYCRYYVKGGGATYSNIASATVTVISSNAGTVTQTPASGSTVCDGGGVQYSCSGMTGTFNQFEYQWNGTGGGWSALSSSNPYTWTTNSPGNTLYVRSKVTNGVCAAAYSSPVSVVVASDPAAPTATKSPNDATVCVGQTLTLTGVTDNGGGTGSCQIEYCYSTNGGSSYSAWSTTLPSFAASGSDNRIKVRKYCNGTGCGNSGENTYSWSVVADPSVTISGGATVCIGGTVSLTSSISGGTGTQSLQWQSSTDDINFNNISGATSASYSAPTSTAGTANRGKSNTDFWKCRFIKENS